MSRDQQRGWIAIGVGFVALAMFAMSLGTGRTWAGTRSRRSAAITGESTGFWVSRKEKPDLYWYNMKIHGVFMVILFGCGAYFVATGGAADEKKRPA